MAKKVKLPKEIGGVKVPKKVRKKGAKLIERLDTPLARELLGAALMAAGAAIAKRNARSPAKPDEHTPHLKTALEPKPGAGTKPHDPQQAGAQFAEMAAGLAANALDRFLRPQRRAAEPKPDAAPPGSAAQ